MTAGRPLGYHRRVQFVFRSGPWHAWSTASNSAARPKVWTSRRCPANSASACFEDVSKEAWQGWIKLQTMIINENRLNLADAQHRKYLMEQAEKYFFGDGVGAPDGFRPH